MSGDLGYRTQPLLTTALVERCLDAYRRLGLARDHAFHATSAHSDRTTARDVDQFLKRELAQALASAFPDATPFLAAIIAKGADPESVVEIHHDWTYTDERSAASTVLWIPLVDIDDETGGLRVVDGSHRWSDGIRASGRPNPAAPLQSDLEARATTIRLAAGEALVYDPAILHGSSGNSSGRPRPAVAVALAPRDADLVHFAQVGEAVLGWTITEDRYTTRPFAATPNRTPDLEPWASPVTTDDLRHGLAS